MRVLFALLLSVLINNSFAQKLVSKPFVGAKTQHAFKVWSMFKKVDSVTIILENENHQELDKQCFVFDKRKAFRKFMPLTVDFDNLLSETTYNIKYQLNYEQIKHDLINVTTDNYHLENVSLLAGSCAFFGTSFNWLLKPFNSTRIFKSMQRDSAQMMLWLGDNVYYIFEKNSHKRQIKKNVQVRLRKNLNRFLNKKEQYSIWDDHDFGSNNSGAEFANKHSSLNVFLQFWLNSNNDSLIYHTFEKEDVRFFMLDDRFYKNDSSILGFTQFEWLKENLLTSKATFNIICIGMQVLNPNTSHESLYNTSHEFKDLMNFINEYKINGVFFLTGDRHFAELVKKENFIGYDLYDLTTSSLSMYSIKKKKKENIENPSIGGTYYSGHNYAKISIEGNPENREMVLQLKNRKGKTVWNYTIKAKELMYK